MQRTIIFLKEMLKWTLTNERKSPALQIIKENKHWPGITFLSLGDKQPKDHTIPQVKEEPVAPIVCCLWLFIYGKECLLSRSWCLSEETNETDSFPWALREPPRNHWLVLRRAIGKRKYGPDGVITSQWSGFLAFMDSFSVGQGIHLQDGGPQFQKERIQWKVNRYRPWLSNIVLIIAGLFICSLSIAQRSMIRTIIFVSS